MKNRIKYGDNEGCNKISFLDSFSNLFHSHNNVLFFTIL